MTTNRYAKISRLNFERALALFNDAPDTAACDALVHAAGAVTVAHESGIDASLPVETKLEALIAARRAAPAIGYGATVCGANDRHGATVVGKTPSGRTVFVQRDKATRTDDNGMSQSQEYTHARDTSADRERFDRQSNGSYKSKRTGAVLWIGERHTYHCFEQ